MISKTQSIRIICLALFFIFSIPNYAQQTTEIGYKDDSNFPKGKMGEVLENLITTINANDKDVVTKFIKNYFSQDFQNSFPMQAHQNYLLNIYRSSGGLKFHSIRNYNPPRKDEVVVILKDTNFESWKAIVLKFVDDKDYSIKSIRYSSARKPSNVEQEPKIVESEFLDKTKELMNRLDRKNLFSGTVLVAKKADVLFEKAAGEASKRFHVANNMDTKFNLGSMNKMFTATAIMQLVEKGKVKLQEPIIKYVDESWLPKEITNKVTIHHLLTHTSGLGSYFNDTYWNGSRELYRTVEEFKPLIRNDTLAFKPGTQYGYSNTGMLLLGVVIQKATNQDYFEYIRENIFKPAAMDNSDSYEMDQPVENLAIGYVPSNNKYGWENNIYKHVIKGGPAGGGFSTARDLHKFAIALINKKLVSQSSLDLLWTDHSDSNYGYGFGIKTNDNGKVVGHSGGFPGISSDLKIFIDSDYIVVVLSNVSSGADPVILKIEELINRLK